MDELDSFIKNQDTYSEAGAVANPPRELTSRNPSVQIMGANFHPLAPYSAFDPKAGSLPYGTGIGSKSGIEDIADTYKSRGTKAAIHTGITDAGEALAPLLLPSAIAAPLATGLALGSGAVAQPIGKYGSQALGADEDTSDLVGDAAALAAGYGGAKLGGAITPGTVGRAFRNPGKVTLGPGGSVPDIVTKGPLKPIPRAISSAFRLVGGPQIADAVIPGHPEPIGETSRLGQIPDEAQPTKQAEMLEQATQDAKDARDQALTQRGQDLMARQANQNKLDAAKVKADNALARSQKSAQMQQGADMNAEIEYNKDLSRRATEAAEENRQRTERASQAEDQRIQVLHDQFSKSLSDLEAHRQATLAARGKLNDQWGTALNRRGNVASGTLSPNAPEELQGNPTPFTPQDLMGRDIAERAARGSVLTPEEEDILMRSVQGHFSPESSIDLAGRTSGRIYASRGTSYRPTNEQLRNRR
jgi:hypothetical protein